MFTTWVRVTLVMWRGSKKAIRVSCSFGTVDSGTRMTVPANMGYGKIQCFSSYNFDGGLQGPARLLIIAKILRDLTVKWRKVGIKGKMS